MCVSMLAGTKNFLSLVEGGLLRFGDDDVFFQGAKVADP